tara:strand:- start:173 stop:319 length:147 start_codon:yes stop_codon:yes gene_type:complete
MINNKENIRMDIYKATITSDAKNKLSRRDFIEFQKLMDKLNPIKRHSE